MPTALVTGVTGQDGVYLARALVADGYRVVGTTTGAGGSSGRVAAYLADVELEVVDLRDAAALSALVAAVEPDEIFNLAAVSSVGRSWDEPDLTYAVNQVAVEVLLDAAREVQDRTRRPVRVLQASSSEVGGGAAESPYARSKAGAEQAVAAARDAGLAACSARFYIHESPIRAVGFVTRKITRGVAEIALGRAERLVLGNLDVVRDWGFAGEYVAAARLMVGHEDPADLPIGTGVPHCLRDVVDAAFAAAGLATADHLEQDPALMRPADSAVLVADPEPAAAHLGWRAKVGFGELIERMVEVDLERLRSGVEDDLAYLAV